MKGTLSKTTDGSAIDIDVPDDVVAPPLGMIRAVCRPPERVGDDDARDSEFGLLIRAR